MYIVTLTYIQPLEKVEVYLEEHRNYLDKYYSKKKFIASGPKNPRTGGVILVNSADLTELSDMIHEDPFYQHGIAEYETINFTPTKFAPEFKDFVNRELA